VHPRTAPGLRVNDDLASAKKHALAHADEPEPVLALDQLGVEASAIIDDPQRDHVRGPAELDSDVLRAAVLGGIRQRFLGDAIQPSPV